MEEGRRFGLFLSRGRSPLSRQFCENDFALARGSQPRIAIWVPLFVANFKFAYTQFAIWVFRFDPIQDEDRCTCLEVRYEFFYRMRKSLLSIKFSFGTNLCFLYLF